MKQTNYQPSPSENIESRNKECETRDETILVHRKVNNNQPPPSKSVESKSKECEWNVRRLHYPGKLKITNNRNHETWKAEERNVREM